MLVAGAIMDLRDLPPRRDPKGGSPRTPTTGIPVADYQAYSTNGNGVWKALAAGAGGLWVMSMVALLGMWAKQGVTQQQLEDYVDKHSPYLMDKVAISQHQSIQDTELGRIAGRQERVIERLGVLESDLKNQTHEVEGIKHDIKLVSDYLEQEKVKK